MASAVYYVLDREGEWKIQLNGKHFGPCPSRDVAVEVAVAAAKRATARGITARVVVQEGEEFRTRWSSWSDGAAMLRGPSSS